MKLILGNAPYCGKSTALLNYAATTGATIVTNDSTGSWLSFRANKLGLSIKHPITYKEFIAQQPSRGIKYYIDDVVEFLREYCPQVEMVTADISEFIEIKKIENSGRKLLFVEVFEHRPRKVQLIESLSVPKKKPVKNPSKEKTYVNAIHDDVTAYP